MSWTELGGAVIAGLIATGVWWIGTSFVRWRQRSWIADLAGTYEVRRKAHPQPEPEVATITVKDGVVLQVEQAGLPDGGTAGGEVPIDPHLKTGHGVYVHLRGDGVKLWGSWDVYVPDKKKGSLLVETTYGHPARLDFVVAPYEWTRISDSRVEATSTDGKPQLVRDFIRAAYAQVRRRFLRAR